MRSAFSPPTSRSRSPRAAQSPASGETRARHRRGAQAAGYPARAAGRRRGHAAAAGQAPAGEGGQEPLHAADAAAEDFPAARQARPAKRREFTLPQKALRRLLGLVQYAMAQQDIRYYLNGLLMVVEEGSLKLVATDGHRLAFASLKLGGRAAAPGSDRAAQDRARAVQAAGRKRRPGEHRAFGRPRPRSASAPSSWSPSWSTASFRTTPGSFPTGHKNTAADRARTAAPGAAARRDPLEREVPRRALGAGRRQPEDRLVQRRAGGSARGARGRSTKAMRSTSASTSTTCSTC